MTDTIAYYYINGYQDKRVINGRKTPSKILYGSYDYKEVEQELQRLKNGKYKNWDLEIKHKVEFDSPLNKMVRSTEDK